MEGLECQRVSATLRSTPGTYRQLLAQTMRKAKDVHFTPGALEGPRGCPGSANAWRIRAESWRVSHTRVRKCDKAHELRPDTLPDGDHSFDLKSGLLHPGCSRRLLGVFDFFDSSFPFEVRTCLGPFCPCACLAEMQRPQIGPRART